MMHAQLRIIFLLSLFVSLTAFVTNLSPPSHARFSTLEARGGSSSKSPDHFDTSLQAFKVALDWRSIEEHVNCNGALSTDNEIPNFQFAPMTEWPPLTSDSKVWPPMPSNPYPLSSGGSDSSSYDKSGGFVIEDDITISRKILKNLKKLMHL
ncbi:hypothetical protein TrST_g7256 [Triparma strigata]|uniref:Uncharacterized protein n=1 Tax=Triparma strigata TaxID=1606541 RepID=A0A9W7EVY1_9STRA|nr:hypothetical protein TrST_g7256 [Triparma strigata]